MILIGQYDSPFVRRVAIADTLGVLEADRSARPSTFWLGESLGHVDITVACALVHLREAHPDFFAARRWPSLAAHVERADALDDFKEIYQPFVVRLGG